VQERHQRPGDASRFRVLDDVAPVYDSGRALFEERFGPRKDFAIGHLASAAHEHRDAGSGFNHSMIVRP